MNRIAALPLFVGALALCAVSCAPSQPVALREPDPLPSAESTVSPPASARWVGYYIAGVPTQTAPLAALEAKTGQPAAVSHYFLGVAIEPFNVTMANNAAAHGSIPLITLEFWDFRKETPEQPEYRLTRITAGDHDAYLRRFAQDAKAFGRPILVRPLHEMNGSWYSWSGTANGNSPADFVAAWRHVHDLFEQEGADLVRFVWSPNADSVPKTPANSLGTYWPGDAYVDYVALEGYNQGGPGGWRSFSRVFDAGYREVTRLSDKPLFIAEIGSSESGGDKAAWIDEMFQALGSAYPRITGVVWFNRYKERDWRIESSLRSLAAYRQGARSWVTTTSVP